MKKLIALLLALVMVLGLVACGAKEETKAPEAENDAPVAENAPAAEGEAEVLEFYHGYFHAETEWPAAKVMRDIYDEFEAQHADGPVVFQAHRC